VDKLVEKLMKLTGERKRIKMSISKAVNKAPRIEACTTSENMTLFAIDFMFLSFKKSFLLGVGEGVYINIRKKLVDKNIYRKYKKCRK